MDSARALQHVERTLELIVEWRTIADKLGELTLDEETKAAKLRARLREQSDIIRQELIVDREIAPAAGRAALAKNLRWIDQPFADGWHAARECLIELRGSLTKAAEIEAIVGPVGPKLAASQLHPAIWDSVRNLWDKGEHGPAIHVASVALEAHIQGALDKRDASGVKLGAAFALDPPSAEWPRFRIRGSAPWSGGDSRVILGVGQSPVLSSAVTVR